MTHQFYEQQTEKGTKIKSSIKTKLTYSKNLHSNSEQNPRKTFLKTKILNHHSGDFDSGDDDCLDYLGEDSGWEVCSEMSKGLKMLGKNSDEISKKPNEVACYRPVYSFSGILNLAEREDIVNAQMKKKKYICKFCGDIYESGCALGGHISKVHRGVGDNYSKKVNNRNEKKIERERSKYFKKK